MDFCSHEGMDLSRCYYPLFSLFFLFLPLHVNLPLFPNCIYLSIFLFSFPPSLPLIFSPLNPWPPFSSAFSENKEKNWGAWGKNFHFQGWVKSNCPLSWGPLSILHFNDINGLEKTWGVEAVGRSVCVGFSLFLLVWPLQSRVMGRAGQIYQWPLALCYF